MIATLNNQNSGLRAESHITLRAPAARRLRLYRLLLVILSITVTTFSALAGGGRAVVVSPSPAGTDVPIAPNERVGAVHVVNVNGEPVVVVRVDPMPEKPDFNIITPDGVSHPFKNGEYVPGINVTWSSTYVHAPDGKDYWSVTATFSQPGVGTVGSARQDFPPGSQRVPDPPQPAGLVFWCPGAYAVDPLTESQILAECGMPDNPWPEVWEVPAGLFMFWHPGASEPEPVVITSLATPTLNIAARPIGKAEPVSEAVQLWQERFDHYPIGSGLHGQGGWKGWGNDPTVEGFVTDAQARSMPQSVDVAGATDLVHEFEVGDTDRWTFTAWQYIPSDFVGGDDSLDGTFFIMMNTYSDEGPWEEQDWSIQLQFDSNDGMLKVYYGNGLNTVNTPYETDRWVQIKAEIDLDQDRVSVFYDGDFLVDYPWSAGVTGVGGGALDIAALDLYANGSTPVYYDDLSLRPAR